MFFIFVIVRWFYSFNYIEPLGYPLLPVYFLLCNEDFTLFSLHSIVRYVEVKCADEKWPILVRQTL